MLVNSNGYLYSFRKPGLVLGCFIILFTAALFSVELGRLYSGSINRGRNDSNVTFQYALDPDTIVGYNGDISNIKPANYWTWPWSTATLFFSLVFFISGALGIISSQRESYTSILTFFIWSLVSLCLMIFLIATYSTIIAGWKSIYGTNDMPHFPTIDKNFSIACLALSCALFLIFVISLIKAGSRIAVCTRKVYPPRKAGYGYLQDMGTPGTPKKNFIRHSRGNMYR